MEWLDEEVALPADLFSAQACSRRQRHSPADTLLITVRVRHNLLRTMSVNRISNASPKFHRDVVVRTCQNRKNDPTNPDCWAAGFRPPAKLSGLGIM